MRSKESRDAIAHVRGNGGTLVLKSIRTLRFKPLAGVLLVPFALLAAALSMAACADDAQTVREANQTPAVSTSAAETPTPSAEIHVTELKDGDCVNSTLPEGISVDTVVIVPCTGDWQFRVLRSFEAADAEAFPDESFFHSQVSENCVRETFSYLSPSAEGWEQGDRTITCLSAGARAGDLWPA